MNRTVITIATEGASRQRKRQAPKGRQVLVSALAEVQASIGPGPWRRDRLIEYLHALQDGFGQLATTHLAALAQLLKLAQTEVFEVASFYHHFDIVREDADGQIAAPPRLTVRVCDGLACELAGATELLAKLPALLDADVRVIPAPCIGRCEQAPAVAVHQHPLAHASIDGVLQAVQAGHTTAVPAPYVGLEAYRASGGYTLLRDCAEGRRDVESVLYDAGTQRPARPGRRGLPRRAQVAHRARRSRAAADGGEHRRRRARHLQGPRAARIRPAPLHRRHADRRLGGGYRSASTSICATSTTAHARCSRAELAKLAGAPPITPLPRIELRRGAGAYICGEESAMIESIEGKRGLPRLRPPYVAQVGLFGRPTLEHNFETLHWVRELLEKGAAWFASQGRHGRSGLRSLFGLGPRA